MDSLWRDVRSALTLLGKNPGFSAAAIAVLAIGIGLNTAMFGMVYGLAFSPRPFPDPDRVVQLYTYDKRQPSSYRAFSYPVYREIAARQDLFKGVLAHNLTLVGVDGGDGADARRSFSAVVSANYFEVLGVELARGRTFTAEEDRPGGTSPVAIASYERWKRSGFPDDVLGSTIRVNGMPLTIVGVAPEGFTGTMMLAGADLYFPLSLYDALTNDFGGDGRRRLDQPTTFDLFLVGRLRDGLSMDAASAAVAALGSAVEQQFPAEHQEKAFSIGPLPRISTSTSPQGDGPLVTLSVVLMGLTSTVLLVVCLNLASMLLARGAARRKEFAIRIAIGASRGRIVRQLLTEGLVLSVAGGAAGIALAAWSMNLLQSTLASRVPITIFFESTATPALIAAATGFCVLATLMFALGPAWRQAGFAASDLKRHAGEDATAGQRRRWLPRHPLVVGQVALSLALLIAAGLFIRMATTAASIDTGYRSDSTIVAEVDAALAGMNDTQALQTYSRLRERLEALPGVSAASVGGILPFGMINIGRDVQRAGFRVEPGATPATPEEGKSFDSPWNAVTGSYFETMGIALKRGRTFSEVESTVTSSPRVAIIDEMLASKLWPAGDALGQRIQFVERGTTSPEMEVVGIVNPTRQDFFEKEYRGAVFVPFAQGFVSNAHFHVRPSSADPAAVQDLTGRVRREIREAAPQLSVFMLRTFSQHVNGSMAYWLVATGWLLFSICGGVAMLVAVIGIYGVEAYAVARRTREIGIRMAVGARPGEVRFMILAEGLRMTGTGLAFGLLLGVGVGRVMSSVFVDLGAFDLAAFVIAPVLFAAAALAACWFPARHATRVDPVRALTAE